MIDNIIKQSFSDYIKVAETDTVNRLPDSLENLPNLIIYGPSGTGKYTNSLNIIKKYSKSELKYAKKILISNSKSDIYIKISDIHFEIDMELLGCNSRILWNDIYYNIIDIISSNENKGIILCKNFHSVNNELLEIFYSYMQSDIFSSYTLKFIILTEGISFIPSSIISVSKVLPCERYTKTFYKREFGASNISDIEILNNLKALKLVDTNSSEFVDVMMPYVKICNSLIDIINNSIHSINFTQLRKILYDILIYNLNVYDCIFYILSSLITSKKIKNIESVNESILENTYIFFKYYNNNYRPIYHLENYILYLIKTVHEL